MTERGEVTVRSAVAPRPPRRGSGLVAVAAVALAFALVVAAWLGAAGVSTSNFSFTMTARQLLPIAGSLLLVLFILGLLVLLVGAIVRKISRHPAALERRLVHACTAVVLWIFLTVTFLPVKGSEMSLRTSGLSTLTLNAIWGGAILLAGLAIGWVVAFAVSRLLATLRERLTPGWMRALGLAAAVVCLAVLFVGPTLRGRGLSRLALPAGTSVADLPRVAIVGVDGCDWEVIGPLVEAGELPTFQRLMESGCYGPLRSMEPMMSPIIWTSISTGKPPEEHGITGFINEAGVPVNATMKTAAPIWDIVSAYGAQVGIVGWYVTWPAHDVNGFMVSDRIHSLLRGPAQIKQSLSGRPTNEVLEGFGEFAFDPGYRRYPETDLRYQQNRIVDEPLRRGYLRDVIYGKIAFASFPQYRPSLMAVYFRGVDFVQHFFWKYFDPEPFGDVPPDDVRLYGNVIRRYCIYQDALLDRLLDALGDDVNVIIVSDHGFQPRLDLDPGRPQLTGRHDIDGVIIAAGPQFRSSGHFEGAGVLDIVPTALAVMGLPVADDMKGRVLLETIRPEHLRDHPLVSVTSYEPDVGRETEETESSMDDALKEELRSLGYIE